ncbi:MAG: hypothetical protein ACR2QE_04240 [Acidimicrobiales bacterium]
MSDEETTVLGFSSTDERQSAYDKMVAALPRFADYQAATACEIPVFRLVRRLTMPTEEGDR